jgi:hypothetical protein
MFGLKVDGICAAAGVAPARASSAQVRPAHASRVLRIILALLLVILKSQKIRNEFNAVIRVLHAIPEALKKFSATGAIAGTK